MPPGGFRVALVNAFDLAAGRGSARGAARSISWARSPPSTSRRGDADEYDGDAPRSAHACAGERLRRWSCCCGDCRAAAAAARWPRRSARTWRPSSTPAQRKIYHAYRTARGPLRPAASQAYWRASRPSATRARPSGCWAGYHGGRLCRPAAAEICGARVAGRYRQDRHRGEAAGREPPLPTVSDFLAQRQVAVRLCAHADHRAGVQAQICPGGACGRADQGSGGAHLRAGDRRAGHLRHAVRHQSAYQAGPADLLGAGVCAAAACQFVERARQARRGVCAPPRRHGRRSRYACRSVPKRCGPRQRSCGACCGRRAPCPTNGASMCGSAAPPGGLGIHALNLDADVGPVAAGAQAQGPEG